MPTTRSVLTAAGVALLALPLLAMAPRVAREGTGRTARRCPNWRPSRSRETR